MKRRGFFRLLAAACSAPFLSRANPQPGVAPAAGVEPSATFRGVPIVNDNPLDQSPEVYGRGRAFISDLPHLRAKPLSITTPGPWQGALRPEGPWHDIQPDGKLENLYGVKEQWCSEGSVVFEDMPVADQAFWNELITAPATKDMSKLVAERDYLVRQRWWSVNFSPEAVSRADLHIAACDRKIAEQGQFELMAFGSTAVRIA